MLDYELDAQIRCFQSGDAREGISAFTEKRAPKFSTAT
jgi:enoyl-CoA hydratase/carnithine racemase